MTYVGDDAPYPGLTVPPRKLPGRTVNRAIREWCLMVERGEASAEGMPELRCEVAGCEQDAGGVIRIGECKRPVCSHHWKEWDTEDHLPFDEANGVAIGQRVFAYLWGFMCDLPENAKLPGCQGE